MTAKQFIPFFEGVETPLADEAEVIEKINHAFMNIQRKAHEKNKCPLRGAHAKCHGVLVGKLMVYDEIPTAYKQGVFKKTGSYDVVARLSTSVSDLAHDRVGGVRGLGLKIMNVEGEMIQASSDPPTSQDFTFVNHPTFPVKDIKEFLMQAELLDKVVSNLPEVAQEAQGVLARAGGHVARMFGVDLVGTAIGAAKPQTHILGDTFYTGVPHRYAEYIAKIAVAPYSPNVRKFEHTEIDASVENALRLAVIEFFSKESAEYEIRVQLCKSLDTMPVEDPSVRWDEDESPYVGVGRIYFPSQHAYSIERSKYSEDSLSFNPWHSLVDHQPLGSVMRARKSAYEQSSAYRHKHSGAARVEPKSAEEIPD